MSNDRLTHVNQCLADLQDQLEGLEKARILAPLEDKARLRSLVREKVEEILPYALEKALLESQETPQLLLEGAYDLAVPSSNYCFQEKDFQYLQGEVIKICQILRDFPKGDKKYSPFDIFIGVLLSENKNLQENEVILHWLQRLEFDFDIIKPSQQIKNSNNSLKFDILFEIKQLNNNDGYFVKAFLVENRKKTSRKEEDYDLNEKDLQEFVRNFVAMYWKRLQNKSRIEFVMPLEYFNSWTVEFWPSETLDESCGEAPDPICDRSLIVLRLPDLFYKTKDEIKGKYLKSIEVSEERWNNLTNAIERQSPEESCKDYMVCGDSKTHNELRRVFKDMAKFGFYLTQPPKLVPKAEDDRIKTLIRDRVPIALWSRQNLGNCQGTFEELLKTPISELLDKIKSLRIEAYNQNDASHIGNHLCCIWDDPYLRSDDILESGSTRQRMP